MGGGLSEVVSVAPACMLAPWLEECGCQGASCPLFMLCGFVPTMSANLRRLVVRLSWHCRRGGLGQCRHLDVRCRICRAFRDRRRRCQVYPTAVSVLPPIPSSASSPHCQPSVAVVGPIFHLAEVEVYPTLIKWRADPTLLH